MNKAWRFSAHFQLQQNQFKYLNDLYILAFLGVKIMADLLLLPSSINGAKIAL